MVKTVTRVYFSWEPSSWIPKPHVSLATHSERASERFDSRTSRVYMIMVRVSTSISNREFSDNLLFVLAFKAYAVLGFMLAACNYLDIYVISPQGPSPPSEDTFVQAAYLFNSAVGVPSHFLGQSLQIILNFRCKTFSGSYRLGPWLMFFGVALATVQYIPNLFDHYNVDSGWSFPTLIQILLAGILAGQAAVYPPVSQQEDVDVE